MGKKAVLLINLGTPSDCDKKSVRRYLQEFLLDPRVIDLPKVIRWILVHFFILPFRTKTSAAAYQKIWQSSGSPLLYHSEQLKLALAQELGDGFVVELGMRYGQPALIDAIEKTKDKESVIVIPLFPQYSSAASGSALELFFRTMSSKWNIPSLKIIKDFYEHPGFIASYAKLIQEHLTNQHIDLLLFSYHGLPLRHINKSACLEKCDHFKPCTSMNNHNLYCYRAQCYATSHAIANSLGLQKNQYAVSFQSRLGRTPWIEPYTDLYLPELIQKGIKNIAIVCPSFVSDCLETLEEVDIRLRQQWSQLGGQHFTFIPCLNTSPLWVKALAEIVRS